jgi:amidase
MDRRQFLATATAFSALATTAPLAPAFAKLDEFAQLDGMGQAALVASGEVSSGELVEATIKRIEKLNPILNAVVHKLYDQARITAATPLPDGPFAGVPYLVKDLSELDGAPLTYGSRLFAHNVADRDNGSVVRAKAAGLVIVGKTNTPEFGFISTTESNLLGAARNPYNTAYHTGGSSGGAAAAVASGMVPFAHASDGGGSIRIPASICGLVGLKPSRGRLFTNSPSMAGDIAVRLAVSRSVRDTAQILNVSEFKNSDARFTPTGFVEGPARRRLKIAFDTRTYTGQNAESDVVDALNKTALLCAKLGHRVDEISAQVVRPEFLDHFMNIWSLSADNVVKNARLAGLMQGRWIDPERDLEAWTRGLSALYQRNFARDNKIIENAIAYFSELENAYEAFFKDYDVLLTPVLRKSPLLIGTQDVNSDFEALFEDVTDYVSYTPQFNASGHPAISLPLYTNATGLPIGSQFIARLGDEKTLLELAYELEAESQWVERWPEISAVRLS